VPPQAYEAPHPATTPGQRAQQYAPQPTDAGQQGWRPQQGVDQVDAHRWPLQDQVDDGATATDLRSAYGGDRTSTIQGQGQGQPHDNEAAQTRLSTDKEADRLRRHAEVEEVAFSAAVQASLLDISSASEDDRVDQLVDQAKQMSLHEYHNAPASGHVRDQLKFVRGNRIADDEDEQVHKAVMDSFETLALEQLQYYERQPKRKAPESRAGSSRIAQSPQGIPGLTQTTVRRDTSRSVKASTSARDATERNVGFRQC